MSLMSAQTAYLADALHRLRYCELNGRQFMFGLVHGYLDGLDTAEATDWKVTSRLRKLALNAFEQRSLRIPDLFPVASL